MQCKIVTPCIRELNLVPLVEEHKKVLKSKAEVVSLAVSQLFYNQ